MTSEILPAVEILVKEVINKENVCESETKIVANTTKGKGYLGRIFTVTIKGKSKNGHVTLNLIVKAAPINKKLRDNIPISLAFKGEIFFYKEILPTFRKLELSNNIEDGFNSFARCYAIAEEEESEGLILENLTTSGYSLWDRKKPMNHGHVSFVLKQYGKLHALSFCLKKTNPDLYQSYAKKLDGKTINEFFETCHEILEENFKNLIGHVTEKESLDIMEKFKDELYNFLKSISEDEHSVLIHGDCWCNNFMFKYDDPSNTTKPSKVCFLDWQISRAASPVLDLSYFFYVNSSKEIVDNLDDYLKIYYESFQEHMKRLGCDANAHFPFSKLEEHWKLYSRYGLILCLIVIRIMISDDEELPDLVESIDLSDNVMETMSFKSSREDEYIDRMKHILNHFIKRKFLE